jgi:adenosyl cobinamide kinase/adenosyl cobinamide phosphate guanylyltransferase
VLTLVMGGIRSGKSDFAAGLASECAGRVAVVVTGLASDPEMEARIEAHRRLRPAAWSVFEETRDIGSAVPPGTADVILLDSVDGWLAQRPDAEACVEQVRQMCDRAADVVAVSSEVGLAPVPLTPAGRIFVDTLGIANQRLAEMASRVYLVVAGLPMTLKELAQ